MSRLNEKYTSEIRQALQEKFQYKNVMEIPKLEKSLSILVLAMQLVMLKHWKLPLTTSLLSPVRNR